ncbi:MAG: SAM-dependent methyltransferase, partial [Bacteroidales bacterium]|nr:SAM-dependent methyltransferase [Bacteroidales bacterium]
MASQTLYLLPASLGEEDSATVLPAAYRDIIAPLRFFFVEEVRTARRFLRRVGFTADFNDVTFVTVNEHNLHLSVDEILREQALDTKGLPTAMGLLSEAGLPCIADPGATVVAWAHAHGLTVKPVSGPSSLFLALMASGLNGQCFAFQGYLPADPEGRKKRLLAIE